VRRALCSVALAVVVLDVTAVGVLLPTLRADLGASPSGGQWIMNAYLLALAVVLPLALRMRVDRRLVAGVGALAMAAGAIVCATADSTSTLVIGRAIEGAGIGALIVPASGAGAAVLPLAALAFGPLIGGEIAERNWWHLYFWAAVPAAALLAAIALQREEARAERAAVSGREFALAVALVAGTIVLVQSEPWGVGSEELVYLVGVGVLTWLVFDLGPDRGAWAVAGGALAALAFLMPQYFELAHLIHPLRSGVRMSALTVPAVVAGLAAWRLREVIPKPIPLVAGVLAVGAGGVALLLIDEHSGNVLFGGGLVLVGAGCGLVAGASGVPDDRERLVAAALGAAMTLAISGALFQHRQEGLRGDGASFEHALSGGVAYGAGILIIAAAALAGATVRARRESSAAPRAAES
jgi:MFS family permease